MKNKKTYIRLSVKTNIIIKTLEFNNPVNVIFLCETHMFFCETFMNASPYVIVSMILCDILKHKN